MVFTSGMYTNYARPYSVMIWNESTDKVYANFGFFDTIEDSVSEQTFESFDEVWDFLSTKKFLLKSFQIMVMIARIHFVPESVEGETPNRQFIRLYPDEILPLDNRITLIFNIANLQE
jgi:hypothetical protein